MPIDIQKVDEFDPLCVPTVTELLGEIDAWDRKYGPEGDEAMTDGAKRTQDHEKTSLKPYVERLMHFAQGLMKEEKGTKREREGGQTDAMEF